MYLRAFVSDRCCFRAEQSREAARTRFRLFLSGVTETLPSYMHRGVVCNKFLVLGFGQKVKVVIRSVHRR